MLNRFNQSKIYSGDTFTADYTEQTGTTGVVISETPFDDITFFHLKKGPGNIRYLGVNLEHYPMFIKGIENCECIFSSLNESHSNWLLLLELKYCACHKLEDYGNKVVCQMNGILQKLIDERLIDPKRYNIYFNFASPLNKEPFMHFMLTQNIAKELQDRHNVTFLGYNQLLMATPQYLQAPKLRL